LQVESLGKKTIWTNENTLTLAKGTEKKKQAFIRQTRRAGKNQDCPKSERECITAAVLENRAKRTDTHAIQSTLYVITEEGKDFAYHCFGAFYTSEQEVEKKRPRSLFFDHLS